MQSIQGPSYSAIQEYFFSPSQDSLVSTTSLSLITQKRETSAINDAIVTLRSALFTPTGLDKDVTASIAPILMKYQKNDCDLEFKFTPKLTTKEKTWAFDICKLHMEDIYDASGYGWEDDDKLHMLTEDGTRFLVVRERENDNKEGDLVAFVHFRFSVQGEVAQKMCGDVSSADSSSVLIYLTVFHLT